MLKTTDFIREFEIKTKTDRDCENILMLEFLKKIAPIDSLLDVGAHHSGTPDSYSFYAAEVRKLVKRYDGIDILDDPILKTIVDNYYVGNANEFFLDRSNEYDAVISVSTIEHSGVSTYKATDVVIEQNKLFIKCLELAKKYVWISIPTGPPYVYPNELSIITERQLTHWEKMVKDGGFKLKERFLHNQAGPQAGTPWREHNKREVACLQPYWDYAGNQAITVMEIEK